MIRMKTRTILFYLAVIVLLGVSMLYFILYPEKVAKVRSDFMQSILVQKISKVTSNAPGPLRFLGEDNGAAHLDADLIVAETNKRRKENTLGPLEENPNLTRAAEMKLKDMVDKQYFEHVSPTGKGPADLAKAAGYSYVLVGENLALGNFEDDSVLLDAWMNSPGHRANILNTRYKEIGVAAAKVTYEGRSIWMAVQEFGKPETDCAPANAAQKANIDAQEGILRAIEADLYQRKQSLESRIPQTQEERAAYNRDVAEYNAVLEDYRKKSALVKEDIAEYNAQVKVFNNCLTQ